MKHHVHPTFACSFDAAAPGAAEPAPHPDAVDPHAVPVWFPIAALDGRSIDSLERLLCRPTRPGAARVAAVPHVAHDVALGDEIALGDWEGEPIARGVLASSRSATIRVVLRRDATDGGTSWRSLAARMPGLGCWFDPIAERAVAIDVPHASFVDVVDILTADAANERLDWELATRSRTRQRAEVAHA